MKAFIWYPPPGAILYFPGSACSAHARVLATVQSPYYHRGVSVWLVQIKSLDMQPRYLTPSRQRMSTPESPQDRVPRGVKCLRKPHRQEGRAAVSRTARFHMVPDQVPRLLVVLRRKDFRRCVRILGQGLTSPVRRPTYRAFISRILPTAGHGTGTTKKARTIK